MYNCPNVSYAKRYVQYQFQVIYEIRPSVASDGPVKGLPAYGTRTEARRHSVIPAHAGA